jgi:hypothetical protein
MLIWITLLLLGEGAGGSAPAPSVGGYRLRRNPRTSQ